MGVGGGVCLSSITKINAQQVVVHGRHDLSVLFFLPMFDVVQMQHNLTTGTDRTQRHDVVFPIHHPFHFPFHHPFHFPLHVPLLHAAASHKGWVDGQVNDGVGVFRGGLKAGTGGGGAWQTMNQHFGRRGGGHRHTHRMAHRTQQNGVAVAWVGWWVVERREV